MVEVGGLGGGIEQDVTQDSYQLSAISNQKGEVDGQLSTDDSGESQWLEVGGLGEGLEGDVTQESYQPSVFSGQGEESQWSEVGGELEGDTPVEMQEPGVTTEIEVPELPVEEVDDSDEEMHYSQRHSWKWIR